MVVPSMATRKRHPNNHFPRLVVGFTVLTAAVAVGGIAGGVFNPAVGVDGGFIALVGWPAVFVFFVAEFLAAVVAGFAFRALNAGDGSKSRELPVPAPGPPARRSDPHPVGWDPRENGSTRAW
ncbi:MAG: aquaporin [Pseudonocardiales bacterium]|jgi:glycerol uptake facilitator-like aquaporin|nr:aquaporin [Pseudonocardiales bacterium]